MVVNVNLEYYEWLHYTHDTYGLVDTMLYVVMKV